MCACPAWHSARLLGDTALTGCLAKAVVCFRGSCTQRVPATVSAGRGPRSPAPPGPRPIALICLGPRQRGCGISALAAGGYGKGVMCSVRECGVPGPALLFPVCDVTALLTEHKPANTSACGHAFAHGVGQIACGDSA